MALRRNPSKTILVPFLSLGEYILHYHWLHGEELGEERLFNCTVRDSEELRSERVELHQGEELHWGRRASEELPLLRFDEIGLWLWLKPTATWWPLREGRCSLDLDRSGRVRAKAVE